VAGKLVTRCAEPYAEGDLITVQLDMEQHGIAFLKNGVLQGSGEGLPGRMAMAKMDLRNVKSHMNIITGSQSCYHLIVHCYIEVSGSPR
jgi:hypothetical protein